MFSEHRRDRGASPLPPSLISLRDKPGPSRRSSMTRFLIQRSNARSIFLVAPVELWSEQFPDASSCCAATSLKHAQTQPPGPPRVRDRLKYSLIFNGSSRAFDCKLSWHRALYYVRKRRILCLSLPRHSLREVSRAVIVPCSQRGLLYSHQPARSIKQ